MSEHETDREIVVGIDDSPSAWAALTWAADHARTTGARLRAVHVLGTAEARELYALPTVTSYVFPASAELDPVWTALGRRVFAAIYPEPSWTLQFGQGHPGQVMVDASAGAELLVLGTREHRGIGRLVNGSISHYCINHAECPVVAVPTAAQDLEPGSTKPPREHRHASAAR